MTNTETTAATKIDTITISVTGNSTDAHPQFHVFVNGALVGWVQRVSQANDSFWAAEDDWYAYCSVSIAAPSRGGFTTRRGAIEALRQMAQEYAS